jgi:hypothetical protein
VKITQEEFDRMKMEVEAHANALSADPARAARLERTHGAFWTPERCRVLLDQVKPKGKKPAVDGGE